MTLIGDNILVVDCCSILRDAKSLGYIVAAYLLLVGSASLAILAIPKFLGP